jgi:hypothetical protein
VAVLINQLEIVVEQPTPPAGEAPPEPTTSQREPSAPPLGTGDVAAALDFLAARAARLRAC